MAGSFERPWKRIRFPASFSSSRLPSSPWLVAPPHILNLLLLLSHLLLT